MNKFVTFAIFALACASATASAQEAGDDATYLAEEMSQYSITTTDTDETKNLNGDLKVFEDFCTQTRDYILRDIRDTTNGLTSTAFTVFFDSIDTIGTSAFEAQKEAAEKVRQQLANPSKPISEEGSDDPTQQRIIDGLKAIQQQGNPLSLFSAIKTILSASSAAFTNHVSRLFEGIKQINSVEKANAAFSNVCEKVSSYKNDVQDRLEQYKKENNLDNAQYGKYTADDVKCATTQRVGQIQSACQFSSSLIPFVQTMMQG